MIETAETWRVVKALERRSGISKVIARGNESTAARDAWERTEMGNDQDLKDTSRWMSGERRHGRKWCPHRESKEGNQGTHPSDLLRVRWENFNRRQRVSINVPERSSRHAQARTVFPAVRMRR